MVAMVPCSSPHPSTNAHITPIFHVLFSSISPIPPSVPHKPWLGGSSWSFSSVLLICGSMPEHGLRPSRFPPQQKLITQFHVQKGDEVT